MADGAAATFGDGFERAAHYRLDVRVVHRIQAARSKPLRADGGTTRRCEGAHVAGA